MQSCALLSEGTTPISSTAANAILCLNASMIRSPHAKSYLSPQTSHLLAFLKRSLNVEFVSIKTGSNHRGPELRLTMMDAIVERSIAQVEHQLDQVFDIVAFQGRIILTLTNTPSCHEVGM